MDEQTLEAGIAEDMTASEEGEVGSESRCIRVAVRRVWDDDARMTFATVDVCPELAREDVAVPAAAS